MVLSRGFAGLLGAVAIKQLASNYSPARKHPIPSNGSIEAISALHFASSGWGWPKLELCQVKNRHILEVLTVMEPPLCWFARCVVKSATSAHLLVPKYKPVVVTVLLSRAILDTRSRRGENPRPMMSQVVSNASPSVEFPTARFNDAS